jgi:hypothetical protein
MNDEFIKFVRTNTISQIAESILSVQPMPTDGFQILYNNSKSEIELVSDGFEPVSHHKLMWIKKEQEQC